VGVHVKITVKAEGFKNGEALLRKGVSGYETIITEELQKFGDEVIEKLRGDAKAGVFGPPKEHDDGKPVLIDTGNYLESYKAEVAGMEMHLGPTGNNKHMTNEQLADVLEYGVGGIPARPHVRPTVLWAESRIPLLARRIARGLLGNR
jgi:hypothetical protein